MNSRPAAAISYVCPHCGAACKNWHRRCWLCAEPLPERAPDAEAGYVVPQILDERRDQSFALSSLMLFMTLVAVCCGAIAAAPGLGIPLAIVSAIALTRTWVVGLGRTPRQGFSTAEKLSTFVSSIGLVALILAAAVIAFGAACFSACGAIALVSKSESAAMFGGLGAGVLAAIVAAVLLFRSTLPQRRK